MGELSSYTNVNASQLDDNDEFILNVDGATKNITAKEVGQVYADFTLLSGTSWDGSNVVKTLTANLALTFAPGTNRLGQLIVIQDATGSRTLSIDGNSIAITSTANAVSVVSYVYDAASTKYRFFVASSILAITGSPVTLTQISTPSAFTATPSGADVNLAWADVANDSGYKVYWSGVNDFGSAGLATTTAVGATSYSKTGLSNGVWYFWVVAAGDGVTYSDSNPASASATVSVTDTTAPVLSTATVENAAPANIVLTYNEALDTGSTPATGDFTPSGGKTVTGVLVSGSTVTVTVNTPYANGDTITISYTPGTNKIRDVAANNAASLTGQAVTNNVASSATYIAFTSAGGANNITQSPTGTWTASGSGNGFGVATTDSLAASANGHVQAQYIDASNVGGVLALDAVNSATDYDQLDYGIYPSAGTWRRIDNGTITDTTIAYSANQYIRLVRTGGNTIKAETSPDATTWTTIHTFAATTTAELFPKITIVVVGNKISEVKGMGLT